MRGTPAPGFDANSVPRIIPARAGNTDKSGWSAWRLADHPRACGEHNKGIRPGHKAAGSSPRVRGTPKQMRTPPGYGRIIPARAGNTRIFLLCVSVNADHPRACGEHRRSSCGEPRAAGSSPRVRGTRYRHWPGIIDTRIIPARAGNTFCFLRYVALKSDHPRACGEHLCWQQSCKAHYGSSPRVRGTLFIRHGGLAACRIIPARAGNTKGSQREGKQCADHPRACGEHFSFIFQPDISAGSSPRVRGTLDPNGEDPVGRRIIPARAGNTL